WIILIGCPAVDHVAWAHDFFSRRGVVAVARVFHRVQVIEVAIEFVEAMHRRQELVQVAEMVLPELSGGVTHGFENRRNGWRFSRYTKWRARRAHGGQAGTDRQFAGDEIGSTSGAARLSVVVGEHHALFG